jgi:Cu(I)/Ag(I) efflux system membrane fusion protein
MFANITLQPITDESVLTIPKSAVIRSGGMTRVVLSEGEGKFRSARIRIGREAGDKVEVLEGLTDKSNVVSSAQFLLDSESSQSADLSRIEGLSTSESIWIEGNITMLMADFGLLTLQHLPVTEWDWDAGKMNFKVDSGIELSDLKEGYRVRFLVEKDKGSFSLKEIEPLGDEQ